MEYPNAQKIVDAAYRTLKGKRYFDWFQSLTEVEQVCESVGRFYYQVCNGGIIQWHNNRYSECSGTLCNSLVVLGCPEVKDIVSNFINRANFADESDFELHTQDLDDKLNDLIDDMMDKLEAYAIKRLTN